MSALSVEPPFPAFADTSGQPLEDGYIWIGAINLNPITNPIVAYWDSALTITAVQPIRTSGGYPVYQGTPANIYVNSDYSIQVQNKNGTVVYSAPAATERYGNIINLVDIDFIQSGVGAVVRTALAKMRETVSVWDFIPVGTNTATADCQPYFQACIDAGHQTIYVPAGTYRIDSTITAPSGTWLQGDGGGETILQGSANVNVLLFQDASVADYTGAGISRLKITGSGAATRLVTVNNVWGFTAQNCFIRGVPTVFRCIEIQRYSFECKIDSCRITDMTESGVYINEIAGEPPNGCVITNCDFSPEDGGYGVYDEASNTRILNNWFEFAFSAGPPIGFGGTSVYSTGSPKIIGNTVTDGYFGDYAIHLDGTNGAIVSSNQINVNGPDATGVFATGCTNTIIDGNQFNIDIADFFVSVFNSDRTIISNNAGNGVISGAYDLLAVYSVGGTSQDTQIVNNAFSFAGTATGKGVIVGANTQLTNITENTFLGLVTGVDVQTNASNRRVNIIGNSLISVTNPIVFVNGLDVYLYNNQGFKTENRGYPATIPSGSNRVTVAHGLAVTPPTAGIRLTLVDALGTGAGATTNNVQGPFVVSVNATNIVMGCGADPGASGMSIGWEVTFSI